MASTIPETLTDELLAERVLLGAGELAAAPGLADGGRGSPEGVPCALYDASKQEVELPCAGDWGDFDQVVLRVGFREGEGCELQVTVEREGKPRLRCITGAGAMTRERWHGWRDVLYPIENFGLVPGSIWGRVTRVQVRGYYGGPTRIASVRLQKRRVPAGTRLTDTGFARAWDWGRPGLKAARLSVERGDFKGAIRGLRAYLARRKKPSLPFAAPPAWPTSLAVADLACRNVVGGQDLGPTFDWKLATGEVGDPDGLHRHYFVVDLLLAWHAARKRKYAAKIDEVLSSWIAASPVPVGHDGKGSRAWSTLTAGCRFKRTWLQVFFGLLGEPALRDRTWFDMLKSMHEHAEFLLRHGSISGTNWTVIESQALSLIGISFPEHRRSASWRDEGLGRLAALAAETVYPDGIHNELSPGYHISSANAFVQPFEVARLNGFPMPRVYGARLRAMYSAIAGLVRPDGTCPAHNDSGGFLRSHDLFLREGARLWKDAGMLWLATGGAEGRPPSGESHGFRNAGLLVMRSGVNAQDRWSLFDVGPFGAGHQHEDALGVETYAFGSPFLVDPGIAGYGEDEFFRYYRSTASHNTLLVDGKGQQRAVSETRESRKRDVSSEIFWASGGTLDVGAGVYAGGYPGVTGEPLHRRAVLFLKPDYWLVVDELEGEGKHSAEALWHFAPMPVVVKGLRAATARAALSNFEIAPALQEGWSLRAVSGQMDPVQGWVAQDFNCFPAFCAIHHWEGTLPMRQVWALVPSAREPLTPAVRVVGTDDRGACVEVVFREGARDVLHIRWGGWDARPAVGGRTDGWLAVERFGADGNRRCAAVVNGSFLRDEQGATVVKGRVSPLIEKPWKAVES
ncbi:MAG: alginate lyase family protein [Verrucomicrobiae bacterium]|nr:alginate lyase family protein [Verrucomicrobiae bacterium]